MCQNENPGREGRPGLGRGLSEKSNFNITQPAASVNDIQAALDRARSDLGLIIREPIADGRLHRCRVENDKPGALSGAYKICLDRPANLWGQNFKTGAKGTYLFGGSSNTWSPAERAAFQARIAEERRQKEAAQRKAWDEAAQRAEKIYADGRPCTGHPYLTAKGVKPHWRLRVSGPDLVAPLLDSFGLIRSLQFINKAGEKKFLPGGRKAGNFLSLDNETTDRLRPVLIAEGVSTGLSLFQATAFETLVAFDAGNLLSVSQAARRAWPGRPILVCADNDSGAAVNIGLVKAKEAALACSGKLAVPSLSGGNRGLSVDFNDLALAEGAAAVRAIIDAALEAEGGGL